MKKDILADNRNPFTVPDGYFDTLRERVMSRVLDEAHRPEPVKLRTFRLDARRAMVAAAACLLLVFTASLLYTRYASEQDTVAETAVDDDFYRWFYASDRATFMAETLDIAPPDAIAATDEAYSEEDEAIIRFLERDNMNVAAIVGALNAAGE